MTSTTQEQVLLHPDYQGAIAELIRSNLAPGKMRQQLLEYHENDIAAALEHLTRDQRIRFFNILDGETLANVLEYAEDRNEYLGELSIRKRVEVLSRMEAGETAEYLRSVPREECRALVELLDEDFRREVYLLSSFDEDEVGSQMTTNYISIPEGLTVRQAMRALIDQAAENDNISRIYVVEEDETYAGAIDLKDLIIAREGTPLDDIIMTSYPYVYAGEEISDCIERIKEYSEDSIPVLDGANRLRGVLPARTVTRLVDEEMGEDYAMLAGLTAEEDLQEPLRMSIRKRLPWLIVLLGLGLVVSAVVGLFEKVVASLTLIVCFQSLILDMAGNVGTQSLAVTIRVLMDEQLTWKQKLNLVFKESRVGLVNGLILGVLSFLCIGGYLALFKGEPVVVAFSVSLCTGLALMAAMFLSSISGTVVPLVFKKLHVDPAVASGPLITTVNDLVAVTAYYGLAWLLLIQVMHM